MPGRGRRGHQLVRCRALAQARRSRLHRARGAAAETQRAPQRRQVRSHRRHSRRQKRARRRWDQHAQGIRRLVRGVAPPDRCPRAARHLHDGHIELSCRVAHHRSGRNQGEVPVAAVQETDRQARGLPSLRWHRRAERALIAEDAGVVMARTARQGRCAGVPHAPDSGRERASPARRVLHGHHVGGPGGVRQALRRLPAACIQRQDQPAPVEQIR